MSLRRTFSITIITLALLVSPVFCSTLALAQEPIPQPPPPPVPKAQPAQDQQDQSDNANPGGDSASLEHPAAVTSNEPQVRQTASAGFLMPSISPLRWGPLYVGFAQFAEILDQGNSLNGAGNLNITASQFSAGLVFDKQFRKVRLAVQYTPRVTVFNGQVFTNFANQDTGFDLVFSITPRLSLDLSNHFIYYRSNDSLVDIFLSADPTSGSTLQKDFIRAPGTWLSDGTTASFRYALSPRTRITIAPYYLYARTSGQAAVVAFPTVNEYSISANLTHDLTPHSTVSAFYQYQTDVFPGASFNTTFQSAQGGYSHSFTGGWDFSGAFGVITVGLQNSRTWSESGSVSVVKRFRRSQAAIAYNRGHTLAGYISQQVTDRVDANYQQYVGRRWTFGGGVGYLRDVATGNGLWGKYGEGNISFGLTSAVSLFGSYVYQWQTGSNGVVFSGSTNYIRCGIQWMPRQPYRR